MNIHMAEGDLSGKVFDRFIVPAHNFIAHVVRLHNGFTRIVELVFIATNPRKKKRKKREDKNGEEKTKPQGVQWEGKVNQRH